MILIDYRNSHSVPKALVRFCCGRRPLARARQPKWKVSSGLLGPRIHDPQAFHAWVAAP
jgi:hypothetical protein